jgi:hypothetical protein
MPEMLSIEFNYKKKCFYALARVKQGLVKPQKEYVITVMNGELESMLYGNHVFSIDNGKVVSTGTRNENVAELRDCISAALNNYLETGNLAHADA